MYIHYIYKNMGEMECLGVTDFDVSAMKIYRNPLELFYW